MTANDTARMLRPDPDVVGMTASPAEIECQLWKNEAEYWKGTARLAWAVWLLTSAGGAALVAILVVVK